FWAPHVSAVHPIPGENARMCELRGAVGWVQYGRMEAILDRTRAMKARINDALRTLPGIKLQRSADPQGDCGLAVVFYLPTTEEAKTFAEALEAEGIPTATIYDKGVPDRHIYRHLDY